jgi:hypothetical protein
MLLVRPGPDLFGKNKREAGDAHQVVVHARDVSYESEAVVDDVRDCRCGRHGRMRGRVNSGSGYGLRAGDVAHNVAYDGIGASDVAHNLADDVTDLHVQRGVRLSGGRLRKGIWQGRHRPVHAAR